MQPRRSFKARMTKKSRKTRTAGVGGVGGGEEALAEGEAGVGGGGEIARAASEYHSPIIPYSSFLDMSLRNALHL